MSGKEQVSGRGSHKEGSAQWLAVRVRRGGGGGYLCEGERVGHRADKDLTQFPI